MNDVKDMLAAALDHGPDPGQPVNPAGDLARGRRLRRRRRMTGLAGAAAGAAAAAGIATAVVGFGPAAPAAPHQPPAAGQHTRHQQAPSGPAGHKARPVLKLVSYNGYQAPGYEVSKVPHGWVVQGANSFALTVAPGNDPNKSVNVFVGKIAVMLLSADEPVPSGTPNVTVAGQPGFLDQQGDTAVLIYKAVTGQWVDIQFPAKLGWDNAQYVRFAAGVRILAAAQPGRG